MQRIASTIFVAVLAAGTFACGTEADDALETQTELTPIALDGRGLTWILVDKYCFPPTKAGALAAELCSDCFLEARRNKQDAADLCGNVCTGCLVDANGMTDCGSGVFTARCE